MSDVTAETFAYYLSESENGWCKIPRRVADDMAKAHEAQSAELSRLSALVAEWRTMDSAPRDGKHVLLCVQSDAFYYAVEGAYHREGWLAAFCDKPVEPVFWAWKPTGFVLSAPPVSQLKDTTNADK